MATRIGYFGQTSAPANLVNYLWNEEAWDATTPGIVTCIKQNATATYEGATSKYPTDNQVITLDNDEYLTGISFGGNTIRNMHSDSRLACFCLCDSNGGSVHMLIPWDTMVSGNYGTITPTQANKSNQSWTDLTGKTIALGKMQGDKYAIYWGEQHRSVTLTTAYLTKTVSLVINGAGTATISSNSLLRGQTATITVTPNSGYKFDHITVSNGSVTRNDVNTFVYTMSTPAEDSVVTVYFKKFTASAKVGGIIYADWYNQ